MVTIEILSNSSTVKYCKIKILINYPYTIPNKFFHIIPNYFPVPNPFLLFFLFILFFNSTSVALIGWGRLPLCLEKYLFIIYFFLNLNLINFLIIFHTLVKRVPHPGTVRFYYRAGCVLL